MGKRKIPRTRRLMIVHPEAKTIFEIAEIPPEDRAKFTLCESFEEAVNRLKTVEGKIDIAIHKDLRVRKGVKKKEKLEKLASLALCCYCKCCGKVENICFFGYMEELKDLDNLKEEVPAGIVVVRNRSSPDFIEMMDKIEIAVGEASIDDIMKEVKKAAEEDPDFSFIREVLKDVCK